MSSGPLTRVAFDTTVSSRPITGVGVYARALLSSLQERHDLALHEWRVPLVASGGHRSNRLLNGARLAAWYAAGVDVRASQEGIHVYHSTTSLGPLRVRRPVVLTIFDATLVTMPLRKGLVDRAFRRCFSVAAARRADAILSPTRASADEVAAAYAIPKERIRVAPLGVEQRFRSVSTAAIEAARMHYGLRFPYVLFVGAEPPRKNLGRLVEAFAKLAPVYPDLHLVFVGPASPRDRQVDEQIERLRLRPRFHRLGSVPRDHLPAIYGGAACLAVLSLCEGFGLPILEGMAAGTPVVASNCSAMPEVAGDAAVLVDPLSVDAIAEGIDWVLGDSDLALDLRRRGRLRSETFDWSVTADLTARVYRDLGGAPRP
jgi:glycosyltransferase involved in cell wall biosynthesis